MPDTIAPAPCEAWPSRPARRPLASCRPAPRPLEPAAADAFRFRIGDVQAAYRLFPAQRAITLVPTDSEIHIALPVRGAAVAATADDTYEAGPGEALLFARAERIVCLWQPGSAGLMLRLPRAAVQAEAARLFESPRRLAGVAAAFKWSDRPAFLAGPPFDPRLLDARGRDEANGCQRSLCASLVRAIAAAGLDTAAFPVAKSVLRALTHIRTHPQGAWTVEDLAPIAGVTAATLRRNFRACLGLTVTQVVREARLDWVRRRLASSHESRSIARLAEAAGFSAANVLARAYQQCFGETPTQTRSRAFASARE